MEIIIGLVVIGLVIKWLWPFVEIAWDIICGVFNFIVETVTNIARLFSGKKAEPQPRQTTRATASRPVSRSNAPTHTCRRIAELVVTCNEQMWSYLRARYDLSESDTLRQLLAVSLVVAVQDHLNLWRDDAMAQAVNAQIAQLDGSYSQHALDYSWPKIWEIYAGLKAEETEENDATSMLFVRILSRIEGDQRDDGIYSTMGTLVADLYADVDVAWRNR